jgi:hypothetical protein
MAQMSQPSRKRWTAARKAALLIAPLVATAAVTMSMLTGPAAAVPAVQAPCTAGTSIITSAAGWFPLTSAAQVFSPSGGLVKAEVVADVGVASGAEVRLGWSVNGGSPVEGGFGPANFANHAEFSESRSTLAVIPVAAGTSRVQPFVRLQAPSSSSTANLLHRCVVVEGQTS